MDELRLTSFRVIAEKVDSRKIASPSTPLSRPSLLAKYLSMHEHSASAHQVSPAQYPSSTPRIGHSCSHNHSRDTIVASAWPLCVGRSGRDSPIYTFAAASPVPAQTWQGAAQSRRRCGRGQPSPGADVAGVSPAAVPVRIWDRWAKCWCTGVNEAVGAAGCSLPPALSRLYRYPPPPCTLASSAPQSQRSVACGARANGSLFSGWTAQRCSIVSTVSTVSTAAV